MKTWQIFVPSLLGLALAGCHSDPELAYLRNDNFKKEQEIYRLRNRVEELQEAVESSAPARPGVLRAAPAEMPLESGPLNGPADYPPRPGPCAGGTGQFRAGNTHSRPHFRFPPAWKLRRVRCPRRYGLPRVVDGRHNRLGRRGRLPAPRSGLRPMATSAGASALRDNAAVAQITLHPALTGGIGTSGRHGDEGLLVVVEPRDFAGNIVNASGSVSVALLDPALTGEQARLARWDFTAAETREWLRGRSRGFTCACPGFPRRPTTG